MREMLELKRKDPDAWLNVWEGNCREILEGAIFAEELRTAKAEGRICNIPYDPVKQVDVYFDLGWADFTSMWFVQPVGLEIRIIDFFQDQLKALQHYLKVMQEKKYIYSTVYLPHDADHKTLAAGGRSIAQQVKAAGYKVRVVERVTNKRYAIHAARAVFPMVYFDEQRCADGLQALRHYRYEYDQDTGKWSENPLHDWASHAADAFESIGIAIKSPKLKKEQPSSGFSNITGRYKPAESGDYQERYA
jgi:phage terminase large subunit